MVFRSLCAVLLLVVAGCATGSPRAAPAVPEVDAAARALHLPFDRYKLSTLDIHTIEHAEDLLVRECMRDHGLDWQMLPPPGRQDPDPRNRRRYGLIERELAERFGYHIPPLSPKLAEREAVWTQRDRLPLAERAAAYGSDGRGGCASRARDALREDLPKVDETRLYDYSGAALDASQRDPAVVRVLDEWGACMAAADFRYPTPAAAFDDPDWAASSRPSAREIAVAEADVRCKRRTHLVEAWSAAETRIQLEVIRAHPADFAGFRMVKDTHLAAARGVIRKLG
jgi:hypothetical protein